MLLLVAVSLIPACGGKSGGGGDPQPFSPEPGTFQILARGGAGDTGNGGNGNYINILGDGVGGNVEAYATGTVNAAVDIPTVKPYLGDNPRTITSSTTFAIGVDISQDTVTIPGDAGGTATGLWVQAGATLTIAPNFDTFLPAGNDTVRLQFANGIFIEGAVVTGARDGVAENAAYLRLDARDIVVAPTGGFDAAGRAGAGPTGGGGGNVIFVLSGTFINNGSITTRGANDDIGGAGGSFTVDSPVLSIFNGGTIDTGGGAGAAGNGGNAGSLMLRAGSYGMHNTGTILATGGNGSANGGWGAPMMLRSGTVGAFTNSGTIDCCGGSSTDNGAGGSAGYFDIEAHSGSARFSGIARARGGDGGPNGGNGGGGGLFYIDVNGANAPLAINRVPEGVFVGGDIDTSGGDGANGGNADTVDIVSYSPGYARPVGITLVGFAAFDASGGDGAVNGGDGGGPCYLENDTCWDQRTNRYYGGRIYNEVPFASRGGRGTAGSGGNGERIFLTMNQAAVTTAPGTGLTNTAPIDTSGGDGAVDGGDGGAVYLVYDTPDAAGAEVGIVNSGALTSNGGNGASGTGGDAGTIGGIRILQYASTGAAAVHSGVTNTGAINCSGGDGGTDGGWGGDLIVNGDFWIRNYAAVSLTGGDGTSGTGGGGSGCDFVVTANLSSANVDSFEIVNTGPIDVSGGAGGVSGEGGGSVDFASAGHIINSGALTSLGGSGGVNGGVPWYCGLYADTYIVNAGAIACSGGAGGTGTGGAGGDVELLSKSTTSAAALEAQGGDTVGGSAGNGADITVSSTEGSSKVDGSTLDSSAGSGGGTPSNGVIRIDGLALDAPTASY